MSSLVRIGHLRGPVVAAALALLLVPLPRAPFARAGDWPQILGPQRNGSAAGEPRLGWSAEAGPRVVWRRSDLGTGYAGPIVVGQRVVVNPSRQCGHCDYCRSGRGNLCRDVRMLGSASTKPPTNGGFSEYVLIGAEQCFPVPPQIDDGLGPTQINAPV